MVGLGEADVGVDHVVVRGPRRAGEDLLEAVGPGHVERHDHVVHRPEAPVGGPLGQAVAVHRVVAGVDRRRGGDRVVPAGPHQRTVRTRGLILGPLQVW